MQHQLLRKQASLGQFHRTPPHKQTSIFRKSAIEQQNFLTMRKNFGKENLKFCNTEYYQKNTNRGRFDSCEQNHQQEGFQGKKVKLSFYDLVRILYQEMGLRVNSPNEINQRDEIQIIKGMNMFQLQNVLMKLVHSFQYKMHRDLTTRASSDLDFLETIKNSRKSTAFFQGQSLSSNQSSVPFFNHQEPISPKYKNTKVELKFDFSDLLAKLQDLENQNNQLKKQNKQANKQLSKMIDSVMLLNDQLGKEQSENEKLREDMKRMENKEAQYQEALDGHKQRYKAQCEDLQKQLKLLQDELESRKLEQNSIDCWKMQQSLCEQFIPRNFNRVNVKKSTRHQSLDVAQDKPIHKLIKNRGEQANNTFCLSQAISQNPNNQDQDLQRCLLIQAISLQKMLDYSLSYQQ